MGGSASVWIPGRRLLTIGMVTLITIAASEALAVATVMPLVERDLGDLPLYGWVFSAFMLGSVVGIVTAGRLADRVRLRAVLAGGLLLFVAGLTAAALAPSMVVLVASRALQGVGAGTIPAVGTVCVARAYQPAARPRMFALFSTAWIIPALIGPGLASRVGVVVGWRWVFGGLIPLAVGAGAVTIGALWTLPRADSGPEEEAGPVMTTIALVIGAAMLLGGLEVEPRALGAVLVVGGGGLAVWALLRLLPVGTFSFRHGLPAAVGIKALFTYAFFAADAFVPLALVGVRGSSPEYAGAVVTTVSLSWAALAWVQERWVRRVGPRPLVRLGFALLAFGTAAMTIVVSTEVPMALSFVAWAVAGAGAGLLFAPLSAAGLAVAERGGEGRASSALLLSESLGIALGTGTAGALVAAVAGGGGSLELGVSLVFAVSIVVALGGAAVAGRLPASVLTAEP